jgi:HlyD family secretion protein
MTRKLLFVLSVLGLGAGLTSAFIFGLQKPALPPAFSPGSNPYPNGIFASGIIESDQSSGANVNVYPEVAGPVVQLLVSEGQVVTKGTTLLKVDDTVQRPTVEQFQSQSESALTSLEELRAQPRKETLDVAQAQAEAAAANLKMTQDQYEKKKAAYEMNPGSVSKEDLDTALNLATLSEANLKVARKQVVLLKAGAWEYDIRTQEHQVNALRMAYLASDALLAKYALKAPVDGVVLSINTALGSSVSPQGVYDTYTQGFIPVVVMGSLQTHLAVRCYIDEILVHRLPASAETKAIMRIRGTDLSIPLEYVRTTPYVSPKVQLSNQRTERVDVRVLPVIFRFVRPKDIALYPGQLVDVYVEEKPAGVGVSPGIPGGTPERSTH